MSNLELRMGIFPVPEVIVQVRWPGLRCLVRRTTTETMCILGPVANWSWSVVVGWEEEETPCFNRGTTCILVDNKHGIPNAEKICKKKGQKSNNPFSILRKGCQFKFLQLIR